MWRQAPRENGDAGEHDMSNQIQVPLFMAVAFVLASAEREWSYIPPPTTPLSNYRKLYENIEKAWAERMKPKSLSGIEY